MADRTPLAGAAEQRRADGRSAISTPPRAKYLQLPVLVLGLEHAKTTSSSRPRAGTRLVLTWPDGEAPLRLHPREGFPQYALWPRAWKYDLIHEHNPTWRDLAEDFGFRPLPLKRRQVPAQGPPSKWDFDGNPGRDDGFPRRAAAPIQKRIAPARTCSGHRHYIVIPALSRDPPCCYLARWRSSPASTSTIRPGAISPEISDLRRYRRSEGRSRLKGPPPKWDFDGNPGPG
jgi:hypothetical protein